MFYFFFFFPSFYVSFLGRKKKNGGYFSMQALFLFLNNFFVCVSGLLLASVCRWARHTRCKRALHREFFFTFLIFYFFLLWFIFTTHIAQVNRWHLMHHCSNLLGSFAFSPPSFFFFSYSLFLFFKGENIRKKKKTFFSLNVYLFSVELTDF